MNLWFELKRFFEDDLQLLIEWLETPIPVLDGEAPVTFINTFIGRNKIREIALEMQYGEFC
ncbi:antitoxin Xre/MbcA/ParS toxin-binding domain-containing protein [Idiomarina aquatica]|uniref:antitoxin Xre/MbcA/ParS toxin-binding domain-containing protein n=1 Tax=Idiomarina aquatica TaxID=1327752 RepID=UPI001414CC74|nr:antitoxin Xre/MbcA/ParS toxin-binding domain-containing protein [Idiomarina aquatica]